MSAEGAPIRSGVDIDWRVRDEGTSSTFVFLAMLVAAMSLGLLALSWAEPSYGRNVATDLLWICPLAIGTVVGFGSLLRAMRLRLLRQRRAQGVNGDDLPFVGLVGAASFGPRDSLAFQFEVGGGRGPDAFEVFVTSSTLQIGANKRSLALPWTAITRVDGHQGLFRSGTLILRTRADEELRVTTQDYPSLLRAIRRATS